MQCREFSPEKNTEELPGGCDDAAGQGSELAHAEKDEELAQGTGNREGGELQQDGGVALHETQELHSFSCNNQAAAEWSGSS